MKQATLLVATALLCAACSIDFNEAVPCESADNCPVGMACDPSTSRCVVGEVADTGTTDTRTRDSAPLPDTDAGNDAVTTNDVTTDQVTTDGTADTISPDSVVPDETQLDTTTDGAACVASVEVCDGRDNDCDDVPDNGINCGTCPSDFGAMALIVRDGGAAYCVDVYEAAREDATLANEGVSANIVAHSTAGVLPWSNMSIAGARQACTGAGKSLCTQEQWQGACGGVVPLAYPYSDTYDGTICNGLEAAESAAGPNGARLLCVSSEGAFDISGNLAEWVESEFAMGGSFNSNSNEMRCDQATVQPDTNAPGRSVGFRCCAAAIPPG